MADDNEELPMDEELPPAEDNLEPLENGSPAERSGHVAVTDGQCMFVWGGYKNAQVRGFYDFYLPRDEIWIYNMETGRWTKHRTSGDVPPSMSGSCAVCMDRVLYLFGGHHARGNTNKPENILCVNRQANQIKIIDFGLARRYKPREKLKVNFGTPEFLAPEVVNYDFVSFPTDMWSVGVIAYMLLSGLSPFLGDDDNETLNNILGCRWDFEDEEFANVSEEAKDFISKLLIKEKSWRISATAALKHPWLSDQKLHSRLLTEKAKCSSTAQAPVTP